MGATLLYDIDMKRSDAVMKENTMELKARYNWQKYLSTTRKWIGPYRAEQGHHL